MFHEKLLLYNFFPVDVIDHIFILTGSKAPYSKPTLYGTWGVLWTGKQGSAYRYYTEEWYKIKYFKVVHRNLKLKYIGYQNFCNYLIKSGERVCHLVRIVQNVKNPLK